MKKVFADTSYWIGLVDTSDFLHDKALERSQTLHGYHILTTDLVLVELLNGFSRNAYLHQLALKATRMILSHPQMIVVKYASLFPEGLHLYEQANDKQWSFTDCISFVLMRKRNITEALTHDHHFEQAGFVALLRN